MNRDDDFPAYSYVPGLWPHPHSDANGHRFKPTFAEIHLDKLDRDPTFRLAVDLFNSGYYWEAHEAWETLWHAAGRSGPIANLLKGLIQLAVVGVKIREGRADGVRTHSLRAAELFEGLTPSVVNEIELARRAKFIAANPPERPAEPRRPIEVVFDWAITLPAEGPFDNQAPG